MTNPLLDSLTPPQREAVEHRDGPLLILAGPGSGKTRVITHRIAHLLAARRAGRGRSWRLTFTNKAAEEMRQPAWSGSRPASRSGRARFTAFAPGCCGQHAALVGLEENFTIYDTSDSRQMLRRVLEAAERRSGALHARPHRPRHQLGQEQPDLARANTRPAPGNPLGNIVAPGLSGSISQRLLAGERGRFRRSAAARRHAAARAARKPAPRSTPAIAISWSTNIKTPTWPNTRSSRALSIDHPNLAVTGDPDQSIYGWRGANLKNILDFEHDFPDVHVVKLERNYRSTKAHLCGRPTR